MSEKIIRTVIQIRRDTEANWLANKDVVLKAGEPAMVLDGENKGGLKLGDGVTTWENLPFLSSAESQVIIQEVEGLKTDVASIKTDLDSANAEIGEVKTDVSSVKSDVNSVKSDVSTISTDVEGLKTTSETHTTEITELQTAVSNKADSDKVYTKEQTDELINDKISGVYRFKGSKDNYADLPVEGNVVGDVWNIKNADPAHNIKAGDNVVWDGTSWDILSGIVDLSGYQTIENAPEKVLEDVVGVDYSADKAEIKLTQGTKQSDGSYLDAPVAIEVNVATSENAGLLSAKDKKAIDSLPHIYTKEKYAIQHILSGTVVDYRDKEIRVMAPVDTLWKLETSGEGANPNAYYMALRAYAPDNAVSFKEDDQAVIEDQTMYYFEDNEFAGTDEYGRKYSVVWLPMATYDAESSTWNYFGKNSSEERYIGWYYTVEWYDVNGVIIATDQIRINLSNESCHYNVKDFYMGGYLQGVLAGETELQKSNGKVTIPMATADALGLVKTSDEITVDADGKLVAVAIPISKLQDDGTVLTIDGGNAID